MSAAESGMCWLVVVLGSLDKLGECEGAEQSTLTMFLGLNENVVSVYMC